MNRTTQFFVIAGIGLATFGFAARQGLVLRRSFKENTSDVYTVTTDLKQTVNVPSMGDQEMAIKTEGTYSLKVGKVDEKGEAAVTMETKIEKIDAEGPMAEAMAGQKPEPIVQEGKMDSRGRFTVDEKKKVANLTAMMIGASQNTTSPMQVVFPEKEVRIGDSWDIEIPKGLFTGEKPQKLTAKLVGEKKVGDREVWVISVTGKLNTQIDTSKLPASANDTNPMANQKMAIKGVVEIEGESQVEKSTGRTIHAEVTSKAKQTVEMIDMGMSVEVAGTTKTLVDLKA